jgi:hypothetical protein
MAIAVDVSLEAHASEDEMAAVTAIFAEAGFDARVSTDPYAKGAGGEFPWMVVIALPAGVFFKAFLEEVAKEAAKDSYRVLKRFIKRLYDARKASQFTHGSVVLTDPGTGKSATLPPEAPDEVWQRLAEDALDGLPSGVTNRRPSGVTFRWNLETGEWQEIRHP